MRRDLNSVDDLITILTERTANNEWSGPGAIHAPTICKSKELQSLGDLIRIRLGVVTWDSSYFLLSESRRRELQLPVGSVTPILSRARHLVSPLITTAQWRALKDDDERVWLFKPRANVIASRAVRSYLRFGRDGGCKLDNHKVSIRDPWFQVLVPRQGDAFMSGMSTHMPWLSFREMRGLAATNTLYVVNFVDPLLSPRHRIGVAVSLLCSEVREQMTTRGRAYAAGLLKHEPSDLLGLQVPAAGTVVANWDAYRRAVRALSEGNEIDSKKIADTCVI